MATLSSWLWGTSGLDEAVDKATSELLPTGADDMALNLEICDQIRSKSVPAKDAMKALKRRLNHKNPNVQLLALTLTDICIKNGGDHFLVEVASREFVDNYVSILKMPLLNSDVKAVMLRLVQNWSTSFEGKPSLIYMCTTYQTLIREGFKFPPKDLTVSTSAMVDTSTAPDWIDSELCMRCRDPFTFTNRKHHCRNCGLVFDQKCSSKAMPLPHFGLTQDVRVCDSCFNKLHKSGTKISHRHSTSLPHRSTRPLRQDNDLQRAIQLSLQETSGYTPSPSSSLPNQYFSEPPLVDRTTRPEDDDPDLKAAIEASLREANAPRPSAPIVMEDYTPARLPTNELDITESDAILSFSQAVDDVHRSGFKGQNVNELYDKANAIRPKLAMSLDDAGRKEQLLTDMNGKLSEAVRLYDQLLTEQLSQPRWRQSQYAYQPQWAPPQTQWAPQSQSQWASQPQPQQIASAPSPTQQYSNVMYASKLPPPQQQHSQPMYASEPTVHHTPSPAQHYSQPVSIPQYAAEPEQNSYASAPQYASPPPQQPQPQQSYIHPPSQQASAPLPQQPSYASPPPQQQQPQVQQVYTHAYAAPSQQASAPPQSQPQASYALPPPQQQQQASYAQSYTLPQFPMAPNFPVAPTHEPEQRRERETQREALLIDL